MPRRDHSGASVTGEASLDYMATGSIITAEELARLSLPNKQVELIRGALVVREPPGTHHGAVSNRLAYLLTSHVEGEKLGRVFGQDTGFKIARDPDTVRAPDVAFVAQARLGAIPERGYAELAPDLVAEVLSPDDRPGEVLTKIADWLEAGVRAAWVLDPRARQVRVYRQDGSVALLTAADSLDGESVVPGFSCRVDELFF